MDFNLPQMIHYAFTLSYHTLIFSPFTIKLIEDFAIVLKMWQEALWFENSQDDKETNKVPSYNLY